MVDALIARKWTTHGKFAYAIPYVHGSGADDLPIRQCLAKLQGKGEAEEPESDDDEESEGSLRGH